MESPFSISHSEMENLTIMINISLHPQVELPWFLLPHRTQLSCSLKSNNVNNNRVGMNYIETVSFPIKYTSVYLCTDTKNF